MEILQQIQQEINSNRLNKIKENLHFLNELKLLERKANLDYYLYIIMNIDLDKNNLNNSYIMWIYNKVDLIDDTKKVVINPGNISMPDIDIDFPKSAIKDIHTYLKNKYGEDKVGSICTFGTLQGRAALKEVMRVHGACDHTLANEICKKLPDKTDILEELEESDDGSMIHYTLLNEPKLLQEWCKIDKDGNFTGSLAKIFEQAIRLEGTIKSVGKHAAGVVIANESISDKCPMIRSSEGTLMCGYEMKSVEKVGYVKFDILTTEVLDVLQECNQMIARGEF